MTKSALSPKPGHLPGRGSIWRHKKGALYRVAIVSRHSEDPDQWLVTYEPVDGGDAWTRALLQTDKNRWPGFLDLVSGAGQTMRFWHVGGPKTWRDEPPAEPGRQQLLEMLDNVSASARNMLGQFGDQMKDEDLRWRRATVQEARAVCDSLLRGEVV